MAVQNSTEKPTIKTESSRSFVKWYSMLIHHFLDYHNAFQYYKPHSIKFSMNGNWGLNWQKVTRELFPLKCRQVCAYFIYVAKYISGICVLIQYIEPTENTLKSCHAHRVIVWTCFILCSLLVSLSAPT